MNSHIAIALFSCIASVSMHTLPNPSVLSNPVDLGYSFDKKTIVFPGGKPFQYLKMFSGEDANGVYYAANDFATAEHCGTHIDAPVHFAKNGRDVADIPLDKLLTKAILIDAVEETGDNYNYALPASKLIEWENENGPIPENCVVLVRFGWSSRYPNRKEYLGPTDTDLRFPGLSAEAAQWIVDSKKVVGVGLDTPSLDPSSLIEYSVHKTLLGADLYGLENLNLAFDLPSQFNIIVMPIKLINGTGGPARVVGVGVDSPSVDNGHKVASHVALAAADIYMLENVNISYPLPSSFNLIVMPMKLVDGSGGPTRIIAY